MTPFSQTMEPLQNPGRFTRAGEQGRGFAVVASEVRALAHRSATAAKQIKHLINDAGNHTKVGRRLAREAGDSMTQMADSVCRVASIVQEIATASLEQSHGIGQVNQAIVQMDEVTQRNAALVEECTAATKVMTCETKDLLDAVSVFKFSPQREQSAVATMDLMEPQVLIVSESRTCAVTP